MKEVPETIDIRSVVAVFGTFLHDALPDTPFFFMAGTGFDEGKASFSTNVDKDRLPDFVRSGLSAAKTGLYTQREWDL